MNAKWYQTYNLPKLPSWLRSGWTTHWTRPGKLTVVEKAHAEEDKKLKENLAQFTEVEKAQKNAEAALSSYEKQVAECLEAQRKAENKLALSMVELKQL